MAASPSSPTASSAGHGPLVSGPASTDRRTTSCASSLAWKRKTAACPGPAAACR